MHSNPSFPGLLTYRETCCASMFPRPGAGSVIGWSSSVEVPGVWLSGNRMGTQVLQNRLANAAVRDPTPAPGFRTRRSSARFREQTHHESADRRRRHVLAECRVSLRVELQRGIDDRNRQSLQARYPSCLAPSVVEHKIEGERNIASPMVLHVLGNRSSPEPGERNVLDEPLPRARFRRGHLADGARLPVLRLVAAAWRLRSTGVPITTK